MRNVLKGDLGSSPSFQVSCILAKAIWFHIKMIGPGTKKENTFKPDLVFESLSQLELNETVYLRFPGK